MEKWWSEVGGRWPPGVPSRACDAQRRSPVPPAQPAPPAHCSTRCCDNTSVYRRGSFRSGEWSASLLYCRTTCHLVIGSHACLCSMFDWELLGMRQGYK
ncbi:unnamed protein product [Colias eurytheme]|nr:unnamed protein product [Colias eurytheme]